MKQIPQLTKVKTKGVSPLFGAAAIGGLVAALTLLLVDRKSESPADHSSATQLESIVKQLHSLEAQINSPDTTSAARLDDLSKNIEELKIQQQKQVGQDNDDGHKEVLKTHRLAQLVIVENIVAKFSNPNSTSSELEAALNLLTTADVAVEDSQKQIFAKRPIMSLSQLLVTFPSADRPQDIAVHLPDTFKKYLGDIKIERLTKDGQPQQQQTQLLVQQALQNKDYNALKEMLASRSDQQQVSVWLENVTSYFSIIQTLNNIQQQLHSS